MYYLASNAAIKGRAGISTTTPLILLSQWQKGVPYSGSSWSDAATWTDVAVAKFVQQSKSTQNIALDAKDASGKYVLSSVYAA